MDRMVQMIVKELEIQKDYLEGHSRIKTVYFGGGTPSLLSFAQIEEILDSIHKHYPHDLEEITIETNPDDLRVEVLQGYKRLGFDRLSIGVQSFDERVLRFYNRAHNARESLEAIEKAKMAGFQKLSIDLMYGFPHPDHSIWEKDLETAVSLDPGHISSYALTIEPNTALGRWARKGKFIPASEDFVAEQFEAMQDRLERCGYIQYEISNFGKPGAFAVHNSNYWLGIPYLGVGPSAHSFNGISRQYNVSNNVAYIKSLEKGFLPFEKEPLDSNDALNEYLLTSLRTIWGVDTRIIRDRYGRNFVEEKEPHIRQLVSEGLLLEDEQRLILTKKGKLLADGIALKLFV